MDDKRGIDDGWKLFSVLGSAIFLLWLLTPWIVFRLAKPDSNVGTTIGVFGDQFGSINALFSGLAFAALIVTLRLQMRELKQNTEELHAQADALQLQVKLMRLSSQLSALPILIGQKRDQLRAGAPKMCEWLNPVLLTPEAIAMVLPQVLLQGNRDETRLREIEKEFAERRPKDSIYGDENGASLAKERESLNKSVTEAVMAATLLQELSALLKSLAETYKQIEDTKSPGEKEPLRE